MTDFNIDTYGYIRFFRVETTKIGKEQRTPLSFSRNVFSFTRLA